MRAGGCLASHFFWVWWTRSMLLCSSNGLSERCCRCCRAWEVRVDLSGGVALEALDDFALAESLGGASFDVVAGGLGGDVMLMRAPGLASFFPASVVGSV